MTTHRGRENAKGRSRNEPATWNTTRLLRRVTIASGNPRSAIRGRGVVASVATRGESSGSVISGPAPASPAPGCRPRPPLVSSTPLSSPSPSPCRRHHGPPGRIRVIQGAGWGWGVADKDAYQGIQRTTHGVTLSRHYIVADIGPMYDSEGPVNRPPNDSRVTGPSYDSTLGSLSRAIRSITPDLLRIIRRNIVAARLNPDGSSYFT
jgi:hypothetical protein